MTEEEVFHELRRSMRDAVIEQHALGSINESTVEELAGRVAPTIDPDVLRELVPAVLADVHGLGPLEGLLGDPTITDIMVVGDRGVWVERDGEMAEVTLNLSPADVARLVERAVAPLGLHLDRANPMLDARLHDGSRLHVVQPPVSLDGTCVTIRRFRPNVSTLDDVAPAPVAHLLRTAVASRRNIIVSGGTGAGKTTLLNALASCIPVSERVITIEDTAELRIPLQHVVRLEARPQNSEGVGEVTLRQLVRTALRMRPDRLLVGEVRGAEAFDMIQAMNVGQAGSMSTCHANGTTATLHRLEALASMSDVRLPDASFRQQLASALDLVIHMERDSDNVRRIVEIAEVLATTDGLVAAPLFRS